MGRQSAVNTLLSVANIVNIGIKSGGMNLVVRARPPDSPQGLRLGLPPHGRVAALGQTRAPRARVKGKGITSVTGLNL